MVWSHIQLKKHDNRKNSGGGGWRWQGSWGGDVGNIWKRGDMQYRGLHKIRGLAPLCQLSQETSKISHQPPPPPFLVKISQPPIIAIFEKFQPPLWMMLFQLPIYHQNKGEKNHFYSAVSMYIYFCYLYLLSVFVFICIYLFINTYKNMQMIIYKYTYK